MDEKIAPRSATFLLFISSVNVWKLWRKDDKDKNINHILSLLGYYTTHYNNHSHTYACNIVYDTYTLVYLNI